MKKRCTNSACRRFFTLNGERTVCPWCGREYRFSRAEKSGVVQDAARMDWQHPTEFMVKRCQEAVQAGSWGAEEVAECRWALNYAAARPEHSGEIVVWQEAGVPHVWVGSADEKARKRILAKKSLSVHDVVRRPLQNRYTVRLKTEGIPCPKKLVWLKALRGWDHFLWLSHAKKATEALVAPTSILHVDGRTLCEMVVNGVDCIRSVRRE